MTIGDVTVSIAIRVIRDWNNLPGNVVEAGSLELFKLQLKSRLKAVSCFKNCNGSFIVLINQLFKEIFIDRANL